MARQAVGIEVNEAHIRVVTLRRGRRGASVGAYASVDHGGAVSALGVVDPIRYRQAFDEALDKAGAGRANLCIAVMYEHVDIRELEFPIMPERDLEYTIRFELSNVVRFGADQDELLFDYVPLPGDQQQGRRRLLSISAPRRVIRGFLDPLYAAGIYPEILEIGAFSLPWVCPREGGVCYLHTGTTSAQVLIYEAQEFRVARQVGVNLAPLVSAAFARVGGGDASSEEPSVAKTFEELAIATERTLEYHRARRRAAAIDDLIDGVIISGELGRDRSFIRDFGHRIGVPATPADPIIGPGDAHIFGDEAPLYAVASGMGARGLERL